MRTYRLQFSTDETILKRRLEKAMSCQSQRLLIQADHRVDRRLLAFDGVCAQEILMGSPMAKDGWDESYRILNYPVSKGSSFALEKEDSLVLQPKSLHAPSWASWLKSFSLEELNRKVFIEFSPWDPRHPQGPTVHEVARFLYSMNFHFPGWRIQRRPGVEMWDSRISSDLELEPLEGACELFNWHQKNPKISVIIPTYNSKAFVYQVLKHLSLQTMDPATFEVVLVDDGSSDGTFAYLRTFGIPSKLQLKYIYWPRPQSRERGDGIFRAGLSRNLGSKAARGELLVFLDSDILVSKRFLQKVCEAMEEKDVLQFPRYHVRQEKSNAVSSYVTIQEGDLYIEEPGYWGNFYRAPDWMKMDFFWKYTCSYALAMRKKDFWSAGAFKRFYLSYGFEDTELGYHLAKMGKKFQLVPEPVYHLTSYSQSEYQLSQIKRRKLLGRTAKQFFLSTLDLDVYQHLRTFMRGDFAAWERFKKRHFDSREKTRDHDGVV